ncbi:MAG TPA: hypothetical protein DEG43_04755 [Acidimicrobiaceae bacterium]|nr:hypothetical protein [Acidimicrobiaceae bacterium]
MKHSSPAICNPRSQPRTHAALPVAAIHNLKDRISRVPVAILNLRRQRAQSKRLDFQLSELVGRPLQRSSVISRGSTAQLVCAWDPSAKATRAFKVFPGPLSLDTGLRVLTEMQAHLVHPNIVRVLDGAAKESAAWVELEYLPGADLERLITDGPLRPSEVRKIVLDLAQGISYLHSQGWIHRDLKPSNIMVTHAAPESRAVIVDLGWAADLFGQRLTRTGTPGGTIGYIAPEVLAGEEETKYSDLWALGRLIETVISKCPDEEAAIWIPIIERLTAKDATQRTLPIDEIDQLANSSPNGLESLELQSPPRKGSADPLLDELVLAETPRRSSDRPQSSRKLTYITVVALLATVGTLLTQTSMGGRPTVAATSTEPADTQSASKSTPGAATSTGSSAQTEQGVAQNAELADCITVLETLASFEHTAVKFASLLTIGGSLVRIVEDERAVGEEVQQHAPGIGGLKPAPPVNGAAFLTAIFAWLLGADHESASNIGGEITGEDPANTRTALETFLALSSTSEQVENRCGAKDDVECLVSEIDYQRENWGNLMLNAIGDGRLASPKTLTDLEEVSSLAQRLLPIIYQAVPLPELLRSHLQTCRDAA